MFAHLLRVSPQTYHLINPRQPADVCMYEAGQLQQCLAFDAHLRSTQDTRMLGPILTPAGYKDLARLFNESHRGPERFSTFERQQDGSVVLCIDGLPMTSEVLGLELTSIRDVPVTLDGRDSQFGPPEDIDTYVMVDMPESANTLRPGVRERIEKVNDLAEELKKFYLARAQHEEEYARGLVRLNELISAHHRNAQSGSLQASVSALIRETEAQAATHTKLSVDIKKEVVSIAAHLSESGTQLEEIMSTCGGTLLENMLRQGTGNDNRAGVAYTPQDIEFMTRCVKLQEQNLSKVKEVMWSSANHVSTACVADDEACEVIRVALEKLEPSEEASQFFSRRQSLPVHGEDVTTQGRASSSTAATPTPSSGNHSRAQPQSEQVGAPSRYLFNVRALFDYEPTADEDLCMKEGDTVGVTMISDDGWWKGELLSGPRRGAVGMVPSNFVTTRNVNLDL